MPARVKRTKGLDLQITDNNPSPLKQREFMSNRCSSFTKNGTRCKLKTLKGSKCWQHMLKEDNLRVKKSNLFSGYTGRLFSGKKPFSKNQKIVPYTGVESNVPINMYFN